jgi:hypothetical protein
VGAFYLLLLFVFSRNVLALRSWLAGETLLRNGFVRWLATFFSQQRLSYEQSALAGGRCAG